MIQKSTPSSLLEFDLEELKTLLKDKGYKTYLAGQLWDWIYKKGIQNFETCSNLSKEVRNFLNENYTAHPLTLSTEQISIDGTRKWLLKLADGYEIETVFIPTSKRGTLCISSQVGCTLQCAFCHTGTQKMVRNLTSGEIIAQLLFAKNRLKDWGDEIILGKHITNIVMMGMGEPLYNYPAVSKALKIFIHPKAFGLSKRHITLSTSGIVPMIEKMGKELNTDLAISLHATNDTLRDQLVPINKKYPIDVLLEACKNYPGMHQKRKITFEYVMLKEINDSDEEARALINLLKDIPAKINLIPFNPWPGSGFECSSKKRIAAFAKMLEKAGYPSPVRTPRGQDIFAACGQLKSLSTKIKASLLKKQALEAAKNAAKD